VAVKIIDGKKSPAHTDIVFFSDGGKDFKKRLTERITCHSIRREQITR
jgi:hypothetical protein